jgi:SAM-dependent methyltransferase
MPLQEPATARLTDDAYWDKTWQGLEIDSKPGAWSFLKEQPADRQLWREILPRFLAPGDRRMIELGSAPGRNLLRWKANFNCDVYGVDFSKTGLEIQRRLLLRHGVESSHSIDGDFLNADFQDAHRESFDIVYSAGLIEHFGDPGQAVAAHLALLRPGGLLVVSIPNIAGFYRHLLPDAVVKAHNLAIMRQPSFAALFDRPELEVLFCGYYGCLCLGIAFDDRSFLHRRVLPYLQIGTNFLSRIVPLPETRWTSPFLLAVSRKRS